jgi:hypothetical protein
MAEKKEKGPRVRSPNFPAVPLEKCLDFVRKLYERFKQTPTPFEIATHSLGYSAKSSVGKQMMAALSYFKLIDIMGMAEKRSIAISQLAFKIIMDNRTPSPERDAAIKESALNPSIFKKIKGDFPDDIPDDEAFDWHLKNKYKFNPASIKDFIVVFKKTMDFAKVYKSDIVPDENNLGQESGMIAEIEKSKIIREIPRGIPGVHISPGAAKEREIANYPVGLGLKARIIFSGESLITTESIEKLIKLLELNKKDLPEKIPDEEKSD